MTEQTETTGSPDELVLQVQRPPERKLSEGWYLTSRYGDVYVTPGGVVWAVEIRGERMVSFNVAVKSRDVLPQKSEKVKKPPADKPKRRKKKEPEIAPPDPATGMVQQTLDELL